MWISSRFLLGGYKWGKYRKVWRYILPSVGGLFVTYLYNVVDGIFVGQGVGWEALGGCKYSGAISYNICSCRGYVPRWVGQPLQR